MKGRPFQYQSHGSAREFSSEDGEGVNLNESLELSLLGVEMRRVMVTEVHANHYSKEPRYFRHFYSLNSICSATPAAGSRVRGSIRLRRMRGPRYALRLR